jgi:hypothetical protein
VVEDYICLTCYNLKKIETKENGASEEKTGEGESKEQ